ncbi:MAG: hypothetical protein ABIJ09_20315 [Pseudomonadota bacterium]
MKIKMRPVVILACCACWLAACTPDGTPGLSGTVELSPDILLKPQTAKRIFVGAYGAEQLASDGWPATWASAKYSTVIDNLAPKDYDYEFVTGSSERLYVYAFLDQNGLEETTDNPEPNVLDVSGESIVDVVGRYARNPVVPIDDLLKDIDIILNVELQP